MGWEFVDDFAEIERVLERELGTAVERTSEAVLSKAKAAAPVGTGKMRDSGRVVRIGQDLALPGSSGVGVDEIQFDAEYAALVHDGYFDVKRGRFVAGRPFLANARTAGGVTLENECNAALDRAFGET